jgi:hypothetical protein
MGKENAKNINRRVSNLTETEVEKKRAIDRANQRYCRAKKRRRLEELEKQVADLSSQLEETQSQLQRFQERERLMRNAFQSVYSLDDDIPPTGPSVEGEQESIISRENDTTERTSSITSLPATLDEAAMSLSSEITSTPPTDELTYAGDPSLASTLLGDDSVPCLPLDFGTGITVNLLPSGREFGLLDLGLDYSRFYPTQTQTQSLFSVDSIETPKPPSEFDSQSALEVLPIWQQISLHTAATSELDQVIIDTTEAGRQWALKSGQQHGELSQPAFPSISSLLNPSSGDKKSRPISCAVAAQVWRSPLTTLTGRIAFMYILSHLVRWFVCRTKKTYDQLPDFIKPTKLQQTIPHPAWIDTVIWYVFHDLVQSSVYFLPHFWFRPPITMPIANTMANLGQRHETLSFRKEILAGPTTTFSLVQQQQHYL